MNKIDDYKQILRQEENQFIDLGFVESLARLLLDELCEWANREIFSPKGGWLTLNIPLHGAPNAGVSQSPAKPLYPRMEIRLSMLLEIYRDSFVFPLISKRIDQETDALKHLNKHEMFAGGGFIFNAPIPDVSPDSIAPQLRIICEAMVDGAGSDGDKSISGNDIRFRFLMFELMLTWTFFHEIGHVVQQHYLFKSADAGASQLDIVYEEFKVDAGTHPSSPSSRGKREFSGACRDITNLAAQARELMADVDGIDLTLRHLLRSGRMNAPISYAFFCSLGCMFQRFYGAYEDNLKPTSGQHPHPAVRDNSAQIFLIEWLVDFMVNHGVVKAKEDAALPIVYLNVRASVMTGLFRSHRVELRTDSSELPSYMRLLTEHHKDEMLWYQKALFPHIAGQTEKVLERHHLLDGSSLRSWLQSLQKSDGWSSQARQDV